MRIRKLFGDSAVYGITGYLTVISGILLTPLYTRYFSKEEYGVMDLLNTWNTFAISIIPLGLITCLLRYYPDFSKDPLMKKKSLGTILTTIVFVSLIYIVIMVISKTFFLDYIDYGNINEIYFHSIFLVVSGILFAFITTVLQASFRKYSYMLIMILNFIIISTLGFVFVFYGEMRLEGFYRASSIAMTTTVIIGFIVISKDLFLFFDKILLIEYLKYSLPILSVFLMFQLTNLLDRALMINYCSLEDVGIYNIGTKISGIVKLVFTAFATAWFPLAMSIKDNEDSLKTYKRVHNVFVLGSFILLTGLFIFRKELIIIFAPSYTDSFNIIGILGIYNAISISIYIYSLGLHIKNQTKYLTISAIGSIVVNATFSILLVSVIGVDGIAWGTLIGGIVWVLIQLYYSQKYFPVSYNFNLSVIILISLLTIMFLTPAFDTLLGVNLFFNISIKGVLLIFILLAMLILKKVGIIKI